MTQVANASSRKGIQLLMNVSYLQAKMIRVPGFSHFLGFTPERLKPSLFRFEKDRLDFRYKLSHALDLSSPPAKADTDADADTDTTTSTSTTTSTTTSTSSTVTLSTYLAILDEVTTWASMASQPNNPRPGVTVDFQLDWGPAAHLGTALGSEVDITATVTKTGRNLGFVRAEVRDKETGQLVCFGYHTKFMPLPRSMEFLLSPWGMWGMNLYVKYILLPKRKKNAHTKQQPQEAYTLSQLLTSLQFESPTTATFAVEPQHLNGLGGLHGGCQAIIMETMARQVAATTGLVGTTPHLDSIRVSYLSGASKQIRITSEILVATPSYVTMRILLQRMDGTLVSEGILSFADSITAASAGKGRIPSYTNNAPSKANTSTTQRTMSTYTSTAGAQSSGLFQSKL